MNYQGVCCPVCGKPFQEGDDIVVCPECGAPHHRECYKSLGHCALQDELHQEGLSWQNPNDQRPQHQAQRDGVQPDQNGNIICPNCGLFCHEEDQFCPNCRFPLHQAPRADRPVVENPFEGEEVSDTGFADMFEAIYADDELDGIPAKDFIFIVRQNYIYFLRVFKIFSQRAKAKIFNWSSFLFGFLYFFYRKMYKIGSILLGIYLLTNIPMWQRLLLLAGGICTCIPESMTDIIGFAIGGVVVVLQILKWRSEKDQRAAAIQQPKVVKKILADTSEVNLDEE